MEREILHLVVPAFPIALARVSDTRLRGRPVAVAPCNSERALLQCISNEAAAEGVVTGIPAFHARKICPSIIVIPPDPMLTSKGTRVLIEVSTQFTPVVEPAAGRVFLDLTGSRRLFGPARDIAARLERSIMTRMGLNAMAGTGGNKLVSRVAADVLPEPGVYDVFKGSERSFLAPFPVSVIPGIGNAREGLLLRDLNLRSVAEVAALSIAQLRLAVGPFAQLLHERACGIDRSPVQIPSRSTEIVTEACLAQEENDDGILVAELCRLVEECGSTLRTIGKEAANLTLTVSYADGVTDQGTKRLVHPLSLDIPLFAAVEELFRSTCRRRVRVRGLRLCCDQPAEQRKQLELFPQEQNVFRRETALQEALDRLREKHGPQTVRWGRALAAGSSAEPSAESSSVPSALSEYRYCTDTRKGL